MLGASCLEALDRGDGRKPNDRRCRSSARAALVAGAGARPLYRLLALAESWEAGALRGGWNGFNVLHLAAARMGALDARLRAAREGRWMRLILVAAKPKVVLAARCR